MGGSRLRLDQPIAKRRTLIRALRRKRYDLCALPANLSPKKQVLKSMNLNQVTLPTLDLAKSISFYQVLGLELIVHAPPRYARFECPEGDATFSLHLVEELPTGAGASIYFECEDLDERVAGLQAKGISFTSSPTDESWRWREARLLDPDNNQLILFWGGEDRKNPPWRLAG